MSEVRLPRRVFQRLELAVRRRRETAQVVDDTLLNKLPTGELDIAIFRTAIYGMLSDLNRANAEMTIALYLASVAIEDAMREGS